MNLSLYRRQLLFSAAIAVVFLALAFATNFALRRLEHGKDTAAEPLSLARVVDEVAAKTGIPKEQAVQILNNSYEGGRRRFELFDPDQFKAQYPNQDLPKDVYTGGHFQGETRGEVIRLSGPNEKYLVVIPLRPSTMRSLMWTNFLISGVFVIMAIALSLFVLFYSMRTKAELVGQVLADLKRGNLRARLPIKKMDEVGRLMLEFNKMADEIEKLVNSVQKKDQARMALLQELAHDLRTPVASLRTVLETLAAKRALLSPEVQQECLGLAVNEVEYFSRLIEDLLFLAQVTEPKYNLSQETADLSELLEDEVAVVAARYRQEGRNIKVNITGIEASLPLKCDPHLIRRLLRNALENAFSFSRHEVDVDLARENGDIKLMVADDGPGLDEAAIEAFGEKRATRRLSAPQDSGRLSVGLGSVIMKTIVQIHRGSLAIANREPNGRPGKGAVLTVRLPVSS